MAVLARPAPRAVLLRQKQPNGQTSRFEPRTANSTLSRTINYQRPGQAILSKCRSNGRFIKAPIAVLSMRMQLQASFSAKAASYQGQPPMAVLSMQKHGQTSRFEPRIANSTVSRRAKQFLAKAGPMAVLSRPAPMAVLSRQRQLKASQAIFSKSQITVLQRPFYQRRSS